MLKITSQRSDVTLETPKSNMTLMKPYQSRDFPPMPDPSGEGLTVTCWCRALCRSIHRSAKKSPERS